MKPTESAFPYTYDFYKNGQRNVQVYTGMDIRTYLAGQAMQGILAGRKHSKDADDLAKESVQYADALIEELNKEKK